MSLQKDFKISSSTSSQLDVYISTNAEHGGVYVIDRHYNSYEDFIDRMYDMCKATGITLIGHDPHDGLMTTFYFQDLSDVYAFDIILNGNSEQPETEYIFLMNESISLDYFLQSIKDYCFHHNIRISDIEKFDEENCIQITTNRSVAMSAILLADKRGIFDLMAMQKMQSQQVEHIFNLDLPRYIVDIRQFKDNFEKVCTAHNVTATFDMDTPYIRRLRITTNSTDDMVTIKKLHTLGIFNVGLHEKASQTLPEFRA